jgi:hypothetical protein
MTMKKLLILLTLLTVRAASGQEFDRWLVPIAVHDFPGLFGTRWTTSFIGWNDRSGILVRGQALLGPTIPPPADIPWYPTIGATIPGEPPGSILYIPRADAGAVHLSANLMQSSASGQDQLSVPIIPESSFADDAIHFLGLENNTDERSHLRVYSLDLDKPSPAVLIQVLARNVLNDWVVAHETELDLHVVQHLTQWPGQLPMRPWAAEIALDPLLEATSLSGPYIVTVTPVTFGLRFWGIVSETHNQSQRVQLMLPQ